MLCSLMAAAEQKAPLTYGRTLVPGSSQPCTTLFAGFWGVTWSSSSVASSDPILRSPWPEPEPPFLKGDFCLCRGHRGGGIYRSAKRICQSSAIVRAFAYLSIGASLTIWGEINLLASAISRVDAQWAYW